jgi:REP element-mobilizing transposase RayT
MTIRKVKFIEGEYFHIYNRGNGKNLIFHDAQDYKRFQKMLYMCNGSKKFKFKDLLKIEKDAYTFDRGKPLVEILAYVQMPNHFHLFLTPSNSSQLKTDKNIGNNVSVFMKRLTTSYSQYYNYKYNRSGSLFEGRFKAEHVNDNNYFKYLFSYIHLNPVKLFQKDWKESGINSIKETTSFLQNYSYSSFKNYFYSPYPVGGESKIVNEKEFLNKIESGTDLNKEIFSWLNFKTIQLN